MTKGKKSKTGLSFIIYISFIRPVSVISSLSKTFVENLLSEFTSVYRKAHSTNHFLLRLIEQWKSGLDNKPFVGVVLMDLSNTFDCIPHGVLIAKLRGYRFTFFYSCLKRHKQNNKINNTFSFSKNYFLGYRKVPYYVQSFSTFSLMICCFF